MRAALRFDADGRLGRTGARGAPARALALAATTDEGKWSYAVSLAFIMGTASLLWIGIVGLSLALR